MHPKPLLRLGPDVALDRFREARGVDDDVLIEVAGDDEGQGGVQELPVTEVRRQAEGAPSLGEGGLQVLEPLDPHPVEESARPAEEESAALRGSDAEVAEVRAREGPTTSGLDSGAQGEEEVG